MEHTGADERQVARLLARSGPEVSVPAGTVTLLLGDVESSSRLWEQDPAAMTTAMAALGATVDEVVGAHNGARPAEQGEGDSFVAAFARASDAVACALDLQLRLVDATVSVRLGLHTGEVQLRDNTNYIGTAVNRCARVRDLGHGGQVLCSRVTADLVIDRLPADASLVELGTYRLRDLGRAERIFQLCHPQLQAEFPPVKALDTTPNNLPVELTSFVGRESDLAATVAALDDGRLVTLTGSGGCGKTRLALQLAAEHLERHNDGVWFVALAPVGDSVGVTRAVCEAVPLIARTTDGTVDAIAHSLRSRDALLVLDNCEHVIGPVAELVDALLRQCPAVQVLATSREPLGIPGEVTWRVPSLSFPDAEWDGSTAALSDFAAVQLFLERATRARPRFTLRDEQAVTVAGICHRLDGLPLAIELAAARMRSLSPAQILEGLHDRFRLLTGGARTAVPRQQTLEASIDWSYDLLLEAERATVRRLSVFHGGFTLEAAESVCAHDEIQPHHVLDLLSQLVDKSLVSTDQDDASGRFHLLETMRYYAARRLGECGETASASARHFHFFVEFAHRRREETEDAYRARVRADYSNMRRAMSWAAEQDDAQLLDRMTGRLFGFWAASTYLAEACEWTRRAIDRVHDRDPQRRARALGRLAQLAVLAEDLPAAVTAADASIETLREMPDKRALMRAITTRASIARELGEPGAADQAGEAVALAEELDDAPALAYALAVQGASALASPEERTRARAALERSIAIARQCGAQHVERLATATLGNLATYECQPHQAIELFGRVLPGLREAGDGYVLSMCLVNLADNLVRLGDLDGATACHAELTAMAEKLGDVRLSSPHASAGHLALARGDWTSAREHYRDPGFTPAWLAGLWEGRRAMIDLFAGDVDAALERLNAFLEESDPTRTSPALPLAIRALIARELDDLPAAERFAHDAVAASPSDPHTMTIVTSLVVLAAVKVDLGDHRNALRLCAAVDRFMRDRGIVLLPVFQRLLTDATTASRVELSDDVVEITWSEGAAMTLADAVAYVGRGRGPRRRPSTGWPSLTPTELEVVRLVADGMSNPQVAARLLMSRRTVTTHLTSVFRKLGLSSRAELVAQAARRDLSAPNS